MLKFSVQTPDLGEAQDELPIRYTGDQLDIGFNASYLLEILRYIPTDEVRLTFKAPERAATVEPEGWKDPASYMCLVMPLRLVDYRTATKSCFDICLKRWILPDTVIAKSRSCSVLSRTMRPSLGLT